MNNKIRIALILIITVLSLLWIDQAEINAQNKSRSIKAEHTHGKRSPASFYDSLFMEKPEYIANEFGFPLGVPDGKGYFISKKFWQKYNNMNHLGEDWSGIGGGDTDFGDTIYAIANGYVEFSEDLDFVWGGVVGIVHKVENKIGLFSDKTIVHDTCRTERGKYRYIESFYAHCSKQYVQKGQWVKKGDPIAAIGNSGGRFQAHLHLELRPQAGTVIFSGGYAKVPDGFIAPEQFMKKYNEK
jgi:murein DD-endopeptidase MepM/ murein hydrolase activator NlpD